MASGQGPYDGPHGECLHPADFGIAQDLGPDRAGETRPVIVEAGFAGAEAAATARALGVEGTIDRSGAHSVRGWRRPGPRYMDLTGAGLICDATIESYYAAGKWVRGSASLAEAICLPRSSWWPPVLCPTRSSGGSGLAVPVCEGVQDLRQKRVLVPSEHRIAFRDSIQEEVDGVQPVRTLSALTGCRTQVQQPNPAQAANPPELCTDCACYRRV